MKTRFYFAAAGLLILLSAFVIFETKTQPVDPSEKRALIGFIGKLNQCIEENDARLKIYFENAGSNNETDSLLARLLNTNYTKGGFNLSFETTKVKLSKLSGNKFEAAVRIKMYRALETLTDRYVSVSFKIARVGRDSMRVTAVNAREFNQLYPSYAANIYRKFLSDSALYLPTTIAAFNVCKTLNARGDSALFFQHYAGQTWYYIKKGAGIPWYELENYNKPWNREQGQPLPATAKTGLTDANGKVVIPARFDLLHNIGATFSGLIEAENNGKRGFFDLEGKAVLPIVYDEILPLNDMPALAVLRKGDNYFWWKKDYSIVIDAAIRIASILPNVRGYKQSFDMNKHPAGLLESADKNESSGIYFPSSHLVDWHLRNLSENYYPVRKLKTPEIYSIGGAAKINYAAEKKHDNWLTALFHSITQGFVDGRAGLYTRKNTVIADNKRNRAYGVEIPMIRMREKSNHTISKCNIYNIIPLNDSVYEARFGQLTNIELPSKRVLTGITSYNYLVLSNQKLVWQETERYFAFTQFIKMDDSYLNGCYLMGKKEKVTDARDKEILTLMRNEILADNGQPVPDKWKETFWYLSDTYNAEKKRSKALSEIDRYNLAFIDQKLANLKLQVLAVK